MSAVLGRWLRVQAPEREGMIVFQRQFLNLFGENPGHGITVCSMQGAVDCPLPVVFFHHLAHMGRVVQCLHLLHTRGEELRRILR